jgi:hypothetical protein
MTIANWIALLAISLPLLISGIVWLVRLEGKIGSTSGRIDNLEGAVKSYGETKLEVVRLQEQIKHLTNLLERYFIPGNHNDGHSNTR